MSRLSNFDCAAAEMLGSSIVLQQLLHGLDLILKPLLLICPRPNPDITLNPDNTILVQHGVALPNDPHDIVP
jgi:hypothetical protein